MKFSKCINHIYTVIACQFKSFPVYILAIWFYLVTINIRLLNVLATCYIKLLHAIIFFKEHNVVLSIHQQSTRHATSHLQTLSHNVVLSTHHQSTRPTTSHLQTLSHNVVLSTNPQNTWSATSHLQTVSHNVVSRTHHQSTRPATSHLQTLSYNVVLSTHHVDIVADIT